MIGRSPSKASFIAASLLSFGLATASFLTHSSPAFAAQVHVVDQHVVSFISDGIATQHVTQAQTVGQFLQERGLTLNQADYLVPSADTPLTDNLTITYKAAVPVTVETLKGSVTYLSSAPDVGALLETEGIYLGKNDHVSPSLADPISANETIRIVRITQWTREIQGAIPSKVVHRIDFTLAPGTSRVIAKGGPGMRVTMVRFEQRDNGAIEKRIIATRIVRAPQERIIAQGVGEYAAFANLARFGLEYNSYVASSAMQMIATAYTAGCSGCSGYTAIGYHAGHGIVAVDPRVIPLGTKLYIPGYGAAVAGDTGGAIVGNRIDLGFNSLSDALLFGRRVVTVYRLR